MEKRFFFHKDAWNVWFIILFYLGCWCINTELVHKNKRLCYLLYFGFFLVCSGEFLLVVNPEAHTQCMTYPVYLRFLFWPQYFKIIIGILFNCRPLAQMSQENKSKSIFYKIVMTYAKTICTQGISYTVHVLPSW